MANTKLDVFNMAMFHVGARSDIADINEKSRPAEVCRLLYDRVRDQVLRAAYWASAKGYSRLAVAAEATDVAWVPGDPEPGFRFAYHVPNDFLYPRYLNTFGRFSLGTRNAETAIYANDEAALLFYTRREENVALWDANLFMAISFALAAYATMPLSGKPQRAANASQQANTLILEARQANANAEDVQLDTIPDWIAARGYRGSVPDTRYFFPYGPMLNMAATP